MARFYFCKYVHHCQVDNELTILDEVSDRYIFLSKEQTKSLVKFMQYEENNVIGRQLAQAGIISSIAGASIKNNTPVTSGVGLLHWNSSIKFKALHLNPFKIIEALITVIKVRRTLKKKGLHCCLEHCRMLLSKANRPRCEDEKSFLLANLYGYYLKLVAPYIPFKMQCLEFSFSLFNMLIKQGVFPVIFIGYQRYDFLSHAWVEVDGNVIMDNDELGTLLNVIVRVGL